MLNCYGTSTDTTAHSHKAFQYESPQSSNQNTVFIGYDVPIFQIGVQNLYSKVLWMQAKTWLVEKKKLNSVNVLHISEYTGSKFVT